MRTHESLVRFRSGPKSEQDESTAPSGRTFTLGSLRRQPLPSECIRSRGAMDVERCGPHLTLNLPPEPITVPEVPTLRKFLQKRQRVTKAFLGRSRVEAVVLLQFEDQSQMVSDICFRLVETSG